MIDTCWCGLDPRVSFTPADQQAIVDFLRFLSEVAPFEPTRSKYPGVVTVWTLPWQWIEYIEGRMGAPPLMWEGDNA